MIHSHENGGVFDLGTNQFPDAHSKYQEKWPSSMDGFSYLLAMNHNTELHVNAIQAANMAQDLPIHEAKALLTPDLLEFKDLVDDIFTSERPMDLIMKHEKMLQKITGMDADNQVSYDVENM